MSICLSLSVSPSTWNNSVPAERIFLKYDILAFFETLSRSFKIYKNLTIITVTLREDQYIFLITSHSFLLRIRNISHKSCTEKQNTHFIFKNNFNKIWDILEKNGRPDRPPMTIWRVGIAFWIFRTTDKYSEYLKTYCISTIKKAARKWLNVTLHVHCCLVHANITLSVLLRLSKKKWIHYSPPSDFTLYIIRSWEITFYYLYYSSIRYKQGR
jgi:hypothetical protein